MTSLDSEQQVLLSCETPVGLDKDPTAYNADSETNYSDQTSKSEDKTKCDYISLQTAARKKRTRVLLLKMCSVAKELAIMLFLAFSFAALTHNPPKVSKSPPAVPFFPNSSVVQDWYRGDLSAALSKARQSDISFIMFYAPWDAECQAVRREFDIAARYMHREVTFLAVNCWQPGSECRYQYTKAYNWPILIAYLSRGKGVHYRGINSAFYMVKFLISLTRPLMRITEESEIHRLVAVNDAVVVGCINALPGSMDYSVLYHTAINMLENDPRQEVPFVVLTGINNNCVNNSENGRVLSLHLWNETLLYPNDEQWRSDFIIAWLLKSLHQISAWALPPGGKSHLLASHLQPGPSLVLFTPKNAIAAKEDYYNLLREVALEYHDCDENNRVTLSSVLSHTQRIQNYLKNKMIPEKCGIKEKVKSEENKFPFVVTYTIPHHWGNNSCLHCKKCDASSTLPSLCSSNSLQHQDLKTNIRKSCDTSKTTLEDTNPRPLSELQKVWEKEKCHYVKLAMKVYPFVYSQSISDFPEVQHHTNYPKCKGLSCEANATLSFIALDSLQHFYFAERLGVDLSQRKDRTAAVIINNQMETHHIMQESVNDETLRQFILNFTNGHLARAFNSESDIKATHTHVYSSSAFCSTRSSSQFCLTELNSETFLPTVLQEGQVVVVLYYSKQCSFCSGVSYQFLTVAKMFSSVSAIRFVRIDGDLNTLPWMFTMERYPTILLFPFRRKSETRVFPQTLTMTVSNILGFMLSNLNPTLKLHAMWTLCNQTKLEEDRLFCIASTRSENMALIEHNLQAWRKADVLTKAKVLYRLQQLRNINLLLALYPQNNHDLDRFLSQLHWSDEQTVIKPHDRKFKFVKDEL